VSEVERHRARRSLGQNFLVDPNIQRRIAEALEVEPGDEVLEIGPGQGALTRHLADTAGRLVAIELDRSLAARLTEEFADRPHVEIRQGDVLDVRLEEVTEDPARLLVVGNIPYNITTPILFSLLERRPRPRRILLMVQKEVADRITAPPGGKSYGALAVGVRSVARAQVVMQVGRKAFRPVPDVESSVVLITPLVPPPLEADEEEAVRRLTREAFGRRRKQFQRTLRDAFGLSPAEVTAVAEETGFDLADRPERFSPEEFVQLSRVLSRLQERSAGS
jgi:16S rRNA (adenine1518-N6/adenine1519-N6)-dimethyltransferase